MLRNLILGSNGHDFQVMRLDNPHAQLAGIHAGKHQQNRLWGNYISMDAALQPVSDSVP